MTVGRGMALLALFAGVALWLVQVRADDARLMARIQTLRAERVALRRECWAVQMETARLRAPEQIRSRADRWHLQVRAPWPVFVDLDDNRYAAGGQPLDWAIDRPVGAE